MAPLHLAAWTRSGQTLYLSGQLAVDASGQLVGDDIAKQTAVTLQNIANILSALRLGPSDVVKTTVWLRDRADFPAFNAAYAAFFGDHKPARSTVVADLLLPDARVEIEAIAIERL